MSDRELLEQAATAYFGADGFEWNSCAGFSGCIQYIPNGLTHYLEWDPLNDDGDALRLATKCMIYFGNDAETGRPKVAWHSSCGMLNSIVMPLTDAPSLPIDINEWARRAIVRAAAEIGKTR